MDSKRASALRTRERVAGESKPPSKRPEAPAQDVVRLSVNLAPDVAETLKQMAASKSISVTETVRRAIAVLKFMEDEHALGNHILVREGHGNSERLREVVLL